METEIYKAPFYYCGAFFKREYFEKTFKKEMEAGLTTVEIIQNKIEEIETTGLVDLWVINAIKLNNLKMDGWFIGSSVFEMPDSMSKKRLHIEVRDMLVKCKLIKKTAPIKSVGYYMDIIDIDKKQVDEMMY